MEDQQNQYNQPEPQFQPRPQPPSRPPSPGAYGGGGAYGGAPQPQQPFAPPAVQPQTPPPPPNPYASQPAVPPNPYLSPPPAPVEKKPSKKPLIIFGLIGLIFIIGAVLALMPSNKSNTSKKSSSAAQQTIQLATFNDPGSGLQFSYKKGWHIATVVRPSPSGRIIYLGPNALSTDSSSIRNKHLNDPELVFNIYDSNPVAGHDTLPIVAPAKKLGTISLANGSVAAMVETSDNSAGKIVVLSACENALCIFKVGSKYVSPSIQTIANASGLAGNNLDETTGDYQSVVKVWQFLNF